MESAKYMKVSSAALLIVTGITVGAIAGLLLAPDEGAKTRKKLFKKAKKYKGSLEDTADDYRKKASDFGDNIAGAASDLNKRFS